MTTVPDDDAQYAELVDDLFEQVLAGHTPDLAATAARHPAVAHRVAEAAALASGAAGRRITPRPSLQGYEIVRELGRGGMGTVYLARQTALDREVALKVLPHTFGLSPHSRERFLAEARALAKVVHPHVVAIHRIVDDGEVLAFEMEYVDGPSLQQLLDHLRAQARASGAPPTLAPIAELLGLTPAQLGARNLTQFFVRLAAKIAGALAVAHAAGLIHRDVKPANVLLRRNGEPVLVDFGLVRLPGPDLSRTGGFAGTPVYSAPEQLRGDAGLGPPADVYGLAVTLYECLTLRTPFVGQSTTELLRRIESGRLTPLRRLAPGAPRDLETILAHAMEVSPRDRYADAGALAEDLQRLQDLQPIRARPVGPLRRLAKFARRQRTPLLAACIGAGLVVAAMVPMLDRADAAGRRREAARQLVQQAQQRIFAVQSRHFDARAAAAESFVVQSPATVVAALRAAAMDYEQAVALDPDEPAFHAELDLLRLALWLRQLAVVTPGDAQRAVDGGDLRRLAANLGPLVQRAARQLALGTLAGDIPTEELATSDPADRANVGLLGFLVGDFDTCEQALRALPPDHQGRPLLDAALGLVLHADGMPSLAYLHLLQAQPHFPGSTALRLGLAETALELGDLDLARHWLATLAGAARRPIELDLRLATEPTADLDGEYAQLVARDPTDPKPRHRLAQLACRRGDLRQAATQLDALIAGWPRVARFRLDRARVALQQRDLAAYARQVFAVLDQRCGRNRSSGTRADLLEILRIGGLDRLHAAAVAEDDRAVIGRALLGGETPVCSFVPGWLAERFAQLLPVVHAAQAQVQAQLAQAPALRSAGSQTLLTAAALVANLNLPAWGWPPRAAAALVPELAPRLHPYVSRWLLEFDVRLSRRQWVPVALQVAAPPADLPPALVWGHALARVDDRTGDGCDEVLAGVVTWSPQTARGRILLLDGRSAAVLVSIEGDSDQVMFGHAVAALRDLDGDGATDWLVGAPAGTPTTRLGTAEVWSGGTGRRIARIEGDGPGFGVAVTGLDDVDGDGIGDFAVSTAPLLRNTAAQGAVHVYSGASRRLLRSLRNDEPGVWFGACLAAVDDVDGDGVGELAVGGNFGQAPGLVRLYAPAAGVVLQSWRDDDPDHGFGTTVLGVGDVDGDGCGDLAVSAVRQAAAANADADEVVILSGATGARLRRHRALQPGGGFGTAATVLRSADGTAVLALGAPFAGAGATGIVEFVDPVGHLLSTVQGPIPSGRFGGALASTTDADGDGRPELFIASPVEHGRGRIWRVASRGVRWPEANPESR